MRVLIKSAVALVLLVLLGCAGSKLLNSNKEQSQNEGNTDSPDPAILAAYDTESMALDAKLEILKAHCWQPDEASLAGGWYVSFEENGQRAPIEDIPCNGALEVAAAAYASYTLDFDVSLRDIIDAGYWPFDVIDPSVNLDDKLFDFRIQQAIALGADFNTIWQFPIGSDEWIIECKERILTEFYRNYYYPTGTTELVPELDASIIDEFWFNSIADRPMNSSDLDGDIILIPLKNYWMPGDSRKLEYDLNVLQVKVPIMREQPADSDASNEPPYTCGFSLR